MSLIRVAMKKIRPSRYIILRIFSEDLPQKFNFSLSLIHFSPFLRCERFARFFQTWLIGPDDRIWIENDPTFVKLQEGSWPLICQTCPTQNKLIFDRLSENLIYKIFCTKRTREYKIFIFIEFINISVFLHKSVSNSGDIQHNTAQCFHLTRDISKRFHDALSSSSICYRSSLWKTHRSFAGVWTAEGTETPLRSSAGDLRRGGKGGRQNYVKSATPVDDTLSIEL